MDLKTIYDSTPSWEWPEDMAKKLQEILGESSSDLSDRLLAAEMAGDTVVFNDEIAQVLHSIVRNGDEPEDLRAKAAISFGAAFEHADLYGFDDPDDSPISKETLLEVQASFKELYHDTDSPKEIRRRILEAAVRAPLEWHPVAVETAFGSDDIEWQLTAVFCMQFVKGFDQQILQALKNDNQDIRYEALVAVGNMELVQAWPSIANLLTDSGVDKTLRLAAINATGGIDLPEAISALQELLGSDDNDIVEAANGALAMLGQGDYGATNFEQEEW